MKKLLIASIAILPFLWGCNNSVEELSPNAHVVAGKKAQTNPADAFTDFVVRIENISTPKAFFFSGSFGSGPAFPGDSYSFSFHAPAGSYLSFATMFVQSNDLFIGPGEMGIALYDASGMRRSGNLVSEVELWDAGTEVNEMPGTGPNQAPRQSGPNTGLDENGNVVLVNDGYSYPALSDVIEVMVQPDPYSATGFTVTLNNISGGSALPSPFAPGVFVVHTMPAPLFTVGAPDRGHGLEGLAEDGTVGMLTAHLAANTGLVTPFSPGLWLVQKQNSEPIFIAGQADFGDGLENIAEDGSPMYLNDALENHPKVRSRGMFNTPVGAAGPAPIFPGGAYEFTITAKHNDYLNFVTMFIQSNDLFVGPSAQGISLFDGTKNPISGDVTHMVELWDAGTEVNEYPGAGPNQAPRQSGPDTGADENGNVMIVNDGFMYPALDQIIKITVTPQ